MVNMYTDRMAALGNKVQVSGSWYNFKKGQGDTLTGLTTGCKVCGQLPNRIGCWGAGFYLGAVLTTIFTVITFDYISKGQQKV